MFLSKLKINGLLEAMKGYFECLVDNGKARELVVRMLLTFAFDLALENGKQPLYSYMPRSSLAPIPLIDFLHCLFGERFEQLVLAALPDNMSSEKNFETAFKKVCGLFHAFCQSARCFSPVGRGHVGILYPWRRSAVP